MVTRQSGQRLPYLPFYGDDFFGSQRVLLMSPIAEFCYVRLLWVAWRDGSIPADPKLCCRLVQKVPWDEFLAAWPEIEPCWEARDGRLTQPYMESLRQEMDRVRKAKSEAGRSGNAARWGAIAERSQSDRRCDGSAIPSGSPPSPSPSPSPDPKDLLPSYNSSTPEKEGQRGEIAPQVRGGGEGLGREGFTLLMEVGYRDKSPTRSADMLHALKKFEAEGGDAASLRKLIGRAKRNGKVPVALLAKWLDTGSWTAELSKRS